MRIFELNRGLLSSPDEVQIGQKLIIPPLLGSGVDLSVNKSTSSSSFFEKVESIGRIVFQGNKQTPAPSHPGPTQKVTPGRQYVVKEGDSLWQIASEHLGDGSRYKEIVKLNTDTIEDESSLTIGTHLKLPAR